jgi:hypothetical protein
MMFDPTVFENIKVVLEGAVYDLDFDGDILVIDRKNNVDLATMSRSYHISYSLRNQYQNQSAEVILEAPLEDLSAEILHAKEEVGCNLRVNFYLSISNVEEDCNSIEHSINGIWGERPKVTQKVSFTYGDKKTKYSCEVALDFKRKINESQIDDINPILKYSVMTLQRLKEIKVP